ncbi:tripartite motif containing 101 isoform 2-T2 [Odontesthes bonariensis]|uniref:tripartite motif containing 101 isoform X2 n=1 Tax=Odontesthes bonariensis TaxID=219752 RepID=UPI003F58A7EE
MQRMGEKLGEAGMSLSADLSHLQVGQGAEREEALASLEKQLMCPICLEIFNKPVVILPCQHNLCRKCANQLYQPSLFQARTTMMVNSGRFRCPSCRHEVVLDRHGVYGLQRNLLVENIIDVYKQEMNNIPSPLPVPPPPTPDQMPTCSDHEGEKVNIYCLTCQVPTCSLCKVFGAHQSCQVAPLTDIYQQQKGELGEGVTSLVAFSEKVQAQINELEKACRNIEENCNTQKQSVHEKFSRMFSILEDRHKVMTQQINSEQDEKMVHAQVLLRCYGDSMEANSKLMERVLSSMEDPDEVAFVQNSKQLITNVIAAATSCPSETLKPGHENLSHFQFNFSKQERALKSIDFIKGCHAALLPAGLPAHPAEGLGLHRLFSLHITPEGHTCILGATQMENETQSPAHSGYPLLLFCPRRVSSTQFSCGRAEPHPQKEVEEKGKCPERKFCCEEKERCTSHYIQITYIHTYIHIYVCVCVCVCTYV